MTERKLLGRIFGPKIERDGVWRIKTNVELNNLIKSRNINPITLLVWPRVSIDK